jgi:PST family polysaccharide transporter
MSIKQKAIQGALWSAIQNWGSQVGSLVVFLVLARLLEPEAFGLVALANVFLAFMQVFLEQGFAQALVQRQEVEREHLDTAFWFTLAIGVALTILSLTSASLVAGFFKQPDLTPILQFFSIIFIVASFSNIQQALLERKFAFRAIASRFLAGTFVGGAIGIAMALWGFGVWSLVSQQLVAELVGTLMLWKASDWRPRFKFSIKHLQELFSFGVSILGCQFLDFINKRADDFLIGYFLDPVALGYYAIAYRVLTVMTQLLVNTSSQIALPTFSRLQQEPDRFRNAFYTATQLTSSLAFPTFLGVVVVAPELVRGLFGEQWMPSVPVMQVLSFVGAIRAVAYFKGAVFMAKGKPSWTLRLSLLGSVLNLIGFIIAVRWGIVAVAYACLICSCIVFPIGQWAISLLIKVSLFDYLRQFIAPLLGSALMAIAILGTKQFLGSYSNLPVLLTIYTIIGAIAYGLALRFFAPKLWQKLFELANLALSPSKHQKLEQ